jgi:2-C-methyl-D-erythritol 2,4-cyclodiphosphate synthase
MRIGHGFDVHAFTAGDHVMLGGVRIAHDRGVAAHSDGDVLIHALCDAIYGALAEGDIGRHFPPGDAQWRGADSRRFLEHAAARCTARGFRLANADLTLVCERPKIAPHVELIRARLAEILDCDIDQLGLKGTTTEKLGFTGRGEGIAAHAVVLLVAAG